MSIGGQDEVADLFDRIAMSTPEQAANAILRGVQKNQRRVLIGADAVLMDATQRLMPTAYQRVLETLFRMNRGRGAKATTV